METVTKVKNPNLITNKEKLRSSNQGNQTPNKIKVSKHKVINNHNISIMKSQIIFLPTHDLSHQVQENGNDYTNLAAKAPNQGLNLTTIMQALPYKDIFMGYNFNSSNSSGY